MPTTAPTFDWRLDHRTGALFPERIERLPLIAFHGTSSRCESAIERDGFCPSPSVASRATIDAVVRLYETLQWAGVDSGGFAVLKPFSLNHDLRKDKKPVFFGESSLRASLFATRSFAGGEAARALRIASHDLQKYIDDPALRDAHTEYLRLNYHYRSDVAGYVEKILAAAPLDWVRSELERLLPLAAEAQRAFDEYRYGVVYAVGFRQDDLALLRNGSPMGIMAYEPIQPDRIVGKVRVPPDWNDTFEIEDRWRLRRMEKRSGSLIWHLPRSSD